MYGDCVYSCHAGDLMGHTLGWCLSPSGRGNKASQTQRLQLYRCIPSPSTHLYLHMVDFPKCFSVCLFVFIGGNHYLQISVHPDSTQPHMKWTNDIYQGPIFKKSYIRGSRWTWSLGGPCANGILRVPLQWILQLANWPPYCNLWICSFLGLPWALFSSISSKSRTFVPYWLKFSITKKTLVLSAVFATISHQIHLTYFPRPYLRYAWLLAIQLHTKYQACSKTWFSHLLLMALTLTEYLLSIFWDSSLITQLLWYVTHALLWVPPTVGSHFKYSGGHPLPMSC